jgi:hypothetical protein
MRRPSLLSTKWVPWWYLGINSSLVTSNASLTVLKLLNMRIAVQNVVTAGVLIAVLTACDEPKITSYRVAKEQTANTTGDPHAGHSHEDTPPPRSRPKITWTLPSGWRETAPGQVNLAAFNIQSAEGKDAQVTVAALPFLAGRETDIVNLWRGQLGLSELTPDQAREQLRDLQVNDEKAKLFELSSGDAAKPDKIVTVMIHRPGASWFYKLSGDSATVDAQRPVFIDFIKSVKLGESDSAPAASSSVPPSAGGFARLAPESWQALPAGPMQVAKFSVPAVQGGTGVVSVSVFDSDTGGTLQNVIRWRKQIGLAGEITSSQLPEVVSTLDAKIPGSLLVNLTNDNHQLLGAIVPRGSQWFFYRLIGNTPAVTPQKEAFVRFATSEL